MPNVVDSFGRRCRRPRRLAPLRDEQVLARGERALGRRAAVLVVADDLMLGLAPSSRRGSPSRGSACSPSPPGSGGRTTLPLPPSSFASRVARELAAPATLSVATKLTCSSPWRSESKTTTGIFACVGALHRRDERLVVERREDDPVHALRRRSSHDVDLRLEVVLLAAAPSRRCRRRAPCAAFTAPAWTLFQNSCVVPFGMTAILSRAPEGAVPPSPSADGFGDSFGHPKRRPDSSVTVTRAASERVFIAANASASDATRARSLPPATPNRDEECHRRRAARGWRAARAAGSRGGRRARSARAAGSRGGGWRGGGAASGWRPVLHIDVGARGWHREEPPRPRRPSVPDRGDIKLIDRRASRPGGVESMTRAPYSLPRGSRARWLHVGALVGWRLADLAGLRPTTRC